MDNSDTTKKHTLQDIFNTKEFENKLMDHVRNNGGTAAIGGQDFIQNLVASALQALLNVEMEEHLGYKKNQGKGTGNARNGTLEKKVRGDFGQLKIKTPRDRQGTFDPQIVKKRQGSLGNFGEKIISLYSRGMTTREIEEHLHEMYGIEVSPQFISRATESLQEEITEWQNRPLEPLYPVVYVDGMRVSVRIGNNSGEVIKKCVYTVLGISTLGRQEVLGLWIEDTEGAKFWQKVFHDLKSRGVKDIFLLCGDGLTGLDKALEAVFPNTDLQLCVVHQIRNATQFVAWKDRRQFCADMRPIYTAPTIEAAKVALDHFEEKWGNRYPMAIASWHRNWDKLTTFFKYPPEIRKVIYTTNTIESLHAQMRKNTSNRKVFPNNESVLRILYLNVKNFTKKWTKRAGWDTLMIQFSIMFGDRLNPNMMEAL